MTNHVALSKVEHKNIRIKTDRSVELGDGVMSCITVPNEFRNVQNHYPILFQLNAERDEFRLIALLGFTQGENLFLKNEKWDARYKPLAIEVQPFLIGKSSKDSSEHSVHIDLDSPKVDMDDGIRVFDNDGKPTEYLESIQAKLGALHDGYQNSPDYIKCLQKYDLIESLVMEIELIDGSVNRLVGFHTINEDKLNKLDSHGLTEMSQNGYLLPTFMILASMSNIVSLVDRKNALVSQG